MKPNRLIPSVQFHHRVMLFVSLLKPNYMTFKGLGYPLNIHSTSKKFSGSKVIVRFPIVIKYPSLIYKKKVFPFFATSHQLLNFLGLIIFKGKFTLMSKY